MANLARAGARSNAVRDFVAQMRGSDIDASLRPIYRYRDEIEEIIRTPEFMLRDLSDYGYIEGDCDDISTLAASISCAMGFPTRLTAIASHGPDDFDHVFSETFVGNWIPVDITVAPGTVYTAFRITSETVC